MLAGAFLQHSASAVESQTACAQAVSGCAVPHSVVPASTRPTGGRLAGYESVGGYARAAAKTSGKHLLGLGEAGFKYVSSQVGQWRSGSWEGASARCAAALHCT